MDKKQAILKIYQELQQETARKTAMIELKNQKPSLTDSKLGGVPYLPKDKEFPINSEGQQLTLLAQINFEDLEDMEDFPSKGLLQFFILGDDIFGLDLHKLTVQDNFRIVYYEHIDCTVKEEDLVEKYNPYIEDEDWLPFNGEYKMIFEVGMQGMSMGDFRYDELFTEKYNEVFEDEPIEGFWDVQEYDDDFFDELTEDDPGYGCKIGGYPEFTQEDPRSYEYEEHDVLLLQIDSIDDDDEDVHIMWGDSGVCNFFITKEDLKNKDFSNVIYNWDCY